jgi:hypothetical protein
MATGMLSRMGALAFRFPLWLHWREYEGERFLEFHVQLPASLKALIALLRVRMPEHESAGGVVFRSLVAMSERRVRVKRLVRRVRGQIRSA